MASTENKRSIFGTSSVPLYFSRPELDEIEAELSRDAAIAGTTEGLSILAKVRTAQGWFA